MNSNFDFDLGLGSNRPKSLNDQKNKPTSSFSSQPKPSWQQPTTAWTHQPAASAAAPLKGPTSMVGDIFGKSWSSTAAPSVSATPIHVVNKNPNLFGDLLSSAMSKPISSANVPLKNAAPNSAKSSFSMGNVADSLPKSTPSGINWGNSSTSGGYNSNNGTSKINNGVNAASTKSPSIGGGNSLRNMSGGGGGIGAKKDPFGSLVDLASKPAGGMKSTAGAASKGSYNNKSSAAPPPAADLFGDFQNAMKPTSATTTTNGGGSFTGSDPFSGFADFGVPANQQKSVPVQSISSDPLDMFFATSSSASAGVGVEQSSGIDDWGTEFGGRADEGEFGGGSTTELEGLPPPPAGVSASGAKSKGMDNYKQGQYPDAIKWLSWAVVLLEKGADRSALADVLSSRASCYKEVGEYKKAVADCTKVLEKDDANVSVLVQRALLYESMEKYRLGAEDLRTVLRIDPGNRVARGTIHCLTKLAD